MDPIFPDGIRLGDLAQRLEQLDLPAIMGETPVLLFKPTGEGAGSPLYNTPPAGEPAPTRHFLSDTSFALDPREQGRSDFAAPDAVAAPVTKSNRSPEADDEIVSIGRGRTNDLRLVSRLVSKHHASFEYLSGEAGQVSGWRLTDLGSSNGTWINGLRLEPNRAHFVKSSDEVVFGDVAALFVDGRGLDALARLVERS